MSSTRPLGGHRGGRPGQGDLGGPGCWLRILKAHGRLLLGSLRVVGVLAPGTQWVGHPEVLPGSPLTCLGP